MPQFFPPPSRTAVLVAPATGWSVPATGQLRFASSGDFAALSGQLNCVSGAASKMGTLPLYLLPPTVGAVYDLVPFRWRRSDDGLTGDGYVYDAGAGVLEIHAVGASTGGAFTVRFSCGWVLPL